LFQIAKETPILRSFVNGKIHQLKVTGLHPNYCVIVDPLDNSIAETLRYNPAAVAFVPAIEE
jgi:hypothetical protein